MLYFKARRKSPTLAPELTPSQRRMMRYFEDAAKATRREIAGNLQALADRIAREPASKIANSLPVEPWSVAQQDMQDELFAEVLDGGSRVSLPIRKASFAFDRDRPEAAAWAAREAGGLIVQITEEQRLLVRDLVASAGLGERTPLQVARALRDSIGLTAEQAQWVENRWGREYAARIAGGASLSDAERGADKAADLYYGRTLRYRSETIARTEILKAAHEGRREAWSQGVQDGWINPGAQKQWETVDDPCEECAAMDGVTVGISEEFAVGDPPLHPNCRCDVLLVDEIPQDIQDMTDEELDAEIERLMSGEPDEGGVEALSPSEVSGASPFMTLEPGESRAATFFAETYEGQSAVKQVLANRAAGLPDFAGIDLDSGAFGFMQNAQFYGNGAQAYTRANLQSDILASADQIARDLAGAQPTTGPLFRGMRVDNPADLFRVGDTVDLRMSSATPNAQVADLYTRPDRFRSGGTPVIMEVRPGVSAANIDRGRMTGNQSGSQEHLLNGAGRVVEVRQEGDKWIVVVEGA